MAHRLACGTKAQLFENSSAVRVLETAGRLRRVPEADYSLAGVLRGSRCGLRSGPSLGRFRPGGAGVRRSIDDGLSLDRLAMMVEPTEASTLRLGPDRFGCYGRRAGEWGVTLVRAFRSTGYAEDSF